MREMSDDFRDVIEKLRLALRLRKPVFTSTSHVALNIDGIDLELSAAEDGQHVMVLGIAGRFSKNPARRSMQAEKILQLNLQHLATNTACVCLDHGDEETPTVVIRGISPCRCAEMDRLAQTISDVALLTETHRHEFEDHPGTSPAQRSTPMTVSSEALIIFAP